MELKNWKTAYKSESFGSKNFGIEIRVAIDRPLSENDERTMYALGDKVQEALMAETMRLDPEAQKEKEFERDKLVGLFGQVAVLVDEIPNGYCNRWCCTQKPWYVVTTTKGRFTIGWRKRVISIEWEPRVNINTAEEIFPGEDVTKVERLIHAWGYEKAQEYISRLLL